MLLNALSLNHIPNLLFVLLLKSVRQVLALTPSPPSPSLLFALSKRQHQEASGNTTKESEKEKKEEKWEQQVVIDEDELGGGEDESLASFGHSLCTKFPLVPVLTAFEHLLKLIVQDENSIQTPFHKKEYVIFK